MRKNICSYFVSLRQEGEGGGHPNVFVSQSEKMSKCLTQIFLFFVFNIKAREKRTLEKRFDGTIFFLLGKKVTCDDSILKFPTGLKSFY